MPKSQVLLVALVCCLACGGGSGDGGGGHGGEPPIPTSGDAAFGAVGHVLISDEQIGGGVDIDRIWVGFDRQEEWDALVRLNERLPETQLPWVGGRVVASPSANDLGFYFEPDTTLAAELSASVQWSSLDQIKANPMQAEATQPGRWMVPATIVRIVPAE